MKQTLSEKVFCHVVEHIRQGRLRPGVKLTEQEISEELSVSHVPVREAMERLHREGWIDRFPHKGAFVKPCSSNDINEMCQIREIIETACMHIVARNINHEQLNKLREVVEQIESAYETKNSDLYEQADAQFHALLVHFLGNKRLEEFFQRIIFQGRNFLYASAIQAFLNFGENTASNGKKDGHREIYEALASGEAEKAEELLKTHMEQGCQMLLIMNKAREVLSGDVCQ